MLKKQQVSYFYDIRWYTHIFEKYMTKYHTVHQTKIS